jgi:hypothetical protein
MANDGIDVSHALIARHGAARLLERHTHPTHHTHHGDA